MKKTVALIALIIIAASGSASAQSPATSREDGLLSALQMAVTLHPSVKSKLEELKALGYDLESSEAQRYPTASLQANTSNNVGTTDKALYDQYGVVAVLQQPLWVGGRIDGTIDQANVKLKIGKLALLGVRRQLMENTAAVYATVQGARLRLEAAKLNVAEHERLKTLITRRESGGIASHADIQMASSRLSQALAQQIQLDGTLKHSLNDLQVLTQQQLSALEPVTDNLALLPEISGIPSAIEKASATVQQKIVEVELARVASDLAVANMLPSLHAKFEQDVYTATQHGETPQGTRLGVVLQGSIEGLGFTGWKRIKSSDARVDAAKRDVENARNDVNRQAQALLTDLQSLQLVLQSYEQLVMSTAETLASFMRQYDAGRKSWVDVLNTQRELSDARLSLEQTRSSLLETRLRLAVELGNLDIQAGAIQ